MPPVSRASLYGLGHTVQSHGGPRRREEKTISERSLFRKMLKRVTMSEQTTLLLPLLLLLLSCSHMQCDKVPRVLKSLANSPLIYITVIPYNHFNGFEYPFFQVQLVYEALGMPQGKSCGLHLNRNHDIQAVRNWRLTENAILGSDPLL